MKFKKLLFYVTVIFLSVNANSQSPGGVNTNLTLWVKANAGTSTTTNGAALDSWTYTNDGSKSFAATGAERPLYSTNSINFLPAITFSGAQLMDGPNGINAPITAGDDDYSLFVVWRSNAGGLSRIWSQRNLGFSNSGNGFALTTFTGPDLYGDQMEYPPYTHLVTRPFTVGSWNVTQLNLLNQATNDLEIVDDRNISSGGISLNTDPGGTPNGAALRTLADGLNRLGARDNVSDEPFNGIIAEVIVYDNSKGTTDRARIFSYLAMKYGIHLSTNLVNSSGSVIWNATTNSTFNNAVFGIGRDDNSGLSVSQSNSMVTGTGNGAGQPGAGNIVLSSPNSLDDQDFLQIGNDNAALTEITTDVPVIAVGSSRLAREWKVAHTGNVGTVSFSFDLTGLTTTGVVGNVNDFRIMVDEDGNGDFTNGTIRYYTPVSFTGNVMNFTGITLNNNEVFTIVTKTNPTLLPVTWKSVNAQLINNTTKLTWEVDNNANALVYNIEFSSNGIDFLPVGSVDNIDTKKSYTFLHTVNVNGLRFYRIRQVDFDNKESISRTVSVRSEIREIRLVLLNNPVRNGHVMAQVITTEAGEATIDLLSVSGARLLSVKQKVIPGENTIRLPLERVQNGNYFVVLRLNGKVETKNLVKQ